MLSAIGPSARSEIAVSRNAHCPVNGDGRLFQQFLVSAESFQKMSKKEEKNGKRSIESDDSFELVSGKKKNTGAGCSASGSGLAGRDWLAVKAASKTKSKVPFHIPTIRKPQEEFNILVDNSNKPFNHVLLKKSEDGKRFIHPLEKLSVSDFVDKDVWNIEPMKPLSLDCTPFKHIEEVEDLKELAAKLHSVDEFAVDLEHNQYRSFQGLTCLMQISTRTEDFIVDTLKLRVHVGPYLREVFKDPTKKKVMHGADRDIIWLQQDFGIYVCNLFDTGQASRVLKLERNSLEYLLLHFCGVAANKQYQNADWRLRPLPSVMVRYAREDTHYLLYIYDLMRIKLASTPIPEEAGNADAPLLDVYKRSYAICMHLYEKELLTEDSFLSLYGLPSAGLNAQQLAIVAGLYEWRDAVARAEDESTGFILPNKTLLEIAKQMPVTTNKLHRLVKSKHWYIERDLASVVSVIRHAMLSGAAFEAAVELLRQRHLEMVAKEKAQANDRLEVDPQDGAIAMDENIESLDFGCSTSEQAMDRKGGSSEHPHANGKVKIKSGNHNPKLLTGEHTSSAQNHNSSTNSISLSLSEITGTTLPMRKKPDRSFVALRTFTPIRNYETDKKEKEEIKLGKEAQLNPVHNGPSQALGIIHPKEPPSAPVSSTNEKNVIIILDDDSDMEYNDSETKNALEGDEEDEPMSQLKPVQEGTSRGKDIMHPEKTFATSVASTNQIDIITIDDDSDSDSDWDQI